MSEFRPVWRPGTFEQAAAEVAAGQVGETHYVELKRDAYPKTDSGRRECGKDIAALAVDGGVLILGVNEDKSTGLATELTPVPVAGCAEWIDQITHERMDPPLTVATTELRNPADPTRAVVVIDVPASPLAPHMVGGRYYGRDDRRARALTDAEVLRLHREREREEERIDKALDEAAAAADRFLPEDPERTAGRVVIVVEPVPLRHPNRLRSELSDAQWWTWAGARVEAALEHIRWETVNDRSLEGLVSTDWTPFRGGRSGERLGRRVAFRHNPLQGRPGDVPYAASLELDEAGAIRLTLNHLTEDHGYRGETRRILHWNDLLSSLLFALGLAAEIADASGASTSVGCGIHLSDIEGVYAAPASVPGGDPTWAGALRGQPYPDADYREVTQVTAAELRTGLAPAIDRLYGPLLRGIGLGDLLKNTST